MPCFRVSRLSLIAHVSSKLESLSPTTCLGFSKVMLWEVLLTPGSPSFQPDSAHQVLCSNFKTLDGRREARSPGTSIDHTLYFPSSVDSTLLDIRYVRTVRIGQWAGLHHTHSA